MYILHVHIALTRVKVRTYTHWCMPVDIWAVTWDEKQDNESNQTMKFIIMGTYVYTAQPAFLNEGGGVGWCQEGLA